jgi:cytochrome c oxidase assembly protein subunit 15
MRHTGAGLAIPDFPLMLGHVIPPYWDPKIAIHFSHRVGAIAVVAAVLTAAVRVWTRMRDRLELVRPATLLVALVSVQATLGALTVLSRLNVWVNSIHVVCGALVLATSLVLTLRAWRGSFADDGTPVRLQAERAPVSRAVGAAHASPTVLAASNGRAADRFRVRFPTSPEGAVDRRRLDSGGQPNGGTRT